MSSPAKKSKQRKEENSKKRSKSYSLRNACTDVPPKCNDALEKLVAPHIDSFNFSLEEGLRLTVSDLDKVEVSIRAKESNEEEDDSETKDNIPTKTFTLWFEDLQVGFPTAPTTQNKNQVQITDRKLLPHECREAGISYEAPMMGTLCIREESSGGEKAEKRFKKKLGMVPIMVKSNHCRLYGLSPKDLIRCHEDMNEVGGYFIINGKEKLVRLIQMQRRNEPLGLIRPSFTKIGKNYSHFGVMIRSVRLDQTAQTITLNYVNDGNCNIRIILSRQEFIIPVVVLLKALVDTNDKEIFQKVLSIANISGDISQTNNVTLLADSVELLLRESKKLKLYTREQCLAYLGSRFRFALKYALFREHSARTKDSHSGNEQKGISDIEVGNYLINKFILVHLDSNLDKFNLLIFMLRKLYALANKEIEPDNGDSPMNQEVLLPGHLYIMLLKDKLQEYLENCRMTSLMSFKRMEVPFSAIDSEWLSKVSEKGALDIGKKLKYFLATGNLLTTSGVDLQQTTGFVIVAERLNYLRFLSHYRSIHRGSFFAEMKTTTVRKLLPESWGFLCPVHTPDGAPCGLLNHLATPCIVITNYSLITNSSASLQIQNTLLSLGMFPLLSNVNYPPNYMDVLLDGKVIGKLDPLQATSIVDKFRFLKVKKTDNIPEEVEVALVLPPSITNKSDANTNEIILGGYPGLYLYTTPSRMMRPVKHLKTGEIELIGVKEQVYMNIACLNEDIKYDKNKNLITTHQEIEPSNILSVVADLTPFSDFNQSPRNMYQCQMGKQTMGTPSHNLIHRTDNKVFRIQTPQVPIVHTKNQYLYDINDYALGTNAVVVVISYTGYDMEDAMIINKSSYERGFGHGSVYKTETLNVLDFIKKDKFSSGTSLTESHFSNIDKSGNIVFPELDVDGLPFVGTKLKKGDKMCAFYNSLNGSIQSKEYKSEEPCIVDGVVYVGGDYATIIANQKGKKTFAFNSSENSEENSHLQSGKAQLVQLKFRLDRNPIIGDKFSSRHGQKGVLSQLWPQVNMPFTESGMTPDVIINPHAFPSRMTIGMLIESMAGKSGSLHGLFQDASPFNYDEENTAVNYFGEQLIKAGYNYYGNEPLYSGTLGTEFHADIYIGVVYYQRLRHMVADKYQARSTGPVNRVTLQPIKGRKKGGGIRLGEMERDSLLAHGVSFTIYDRLMDCSDGVNTFVCTSCGSLISPTGEDNLKRFKSQSFISHNKVVCRICDSPSFIDAITVPQVFRYLVAELTAMNIKVVVDIK